MSVDAILASSFDDITLTQAGTSTIVTIDGVEDASFVLLNTNAVDITADTFDFSAPSSLRAPDGLADGLELTLADTSATPELASLVSAFVDEAESDSLAGEAVTLLDNDFTFPDAEDFDTGPLIGDFDFTLI